MSCSLERPPASSATRSRRLTGSSSVVVVSVCVGVLPDGQVHDGLRRRLRAAGRILGEDGADLVRVGHVLLGRLAI